MLEYIIEHQNVELFCCIQHIGEKTFSDNGAMLAGPSRQAWIGFESAAVVAGVSCPADEPAVCCTNIEQITALTAADSGEPIKHQRKIVQSQSLQGLAARIFVQLLPCGGVQNLRRQS
jgi:hypothetical protein